MRPAKALRPPAQYGAENCSWRGFYAVVIAAAKCMSAMVSKRGAIIARALSSTMAPRCISFGGLRSDNAVGTEVLRVLKPLGIDAAVRWRLRRVRSRPH